MPMPGKRRFSIKNLLNRTKENEAAKIHTAQKKLEEKRSAVARLEGIQLSPGAKPTNRPKRKVSDRPQLKKIWPFK